MAQASTLARLHQGEQLRAIARNLPPVKTENFSDLQIDVSAPAPVATRLTGFRVHRDEAEMADYRADTAPLMSRVAESAPPDQSSRFFALAQREQADRLMHRYAHRIRGGF